MIEPIGTKPTIVPSGPAGNVGTQFDSAVKHAEELAKLGRIAHPYPPGEVPEIQDVPEEEPLVSPVTSGAEAETNNQDGQRPSWSTEEYLIFRGVLPPEPPQ